MTKYVDIPPDEFGPGCKIDLSNNRMIGASGKVYTNIQINIADFDRLCDDLKIPRMPRS